MLQNILKQNTGVFHKVINFENKKLYKFDFSENNKELTSDVIKDSRSLSDYINSTLRNNNADIGYGGYVENRAIYKKSEHFGGNAENSRTIHLGIDIWCNVNEPVFSPNEAKVHSFKNNSNFGDYGATIILKHKIENVIFYTLYGHLSLKSLDNIEVNQVIMKGEKIAEIGNEKENGNWPPHLHFQIISDMQNYFGDFPGVCTVAEKSKFIKLCPNPNLILNIDK
ncbi:MAG: peptidoglycan DD-metalloendopeptidase family protein [Bacteroidota bacterium]|nr:peptidoglycan DD-metalloendopeptidase family protein [Bacteroidota bacterium]